MSSALDNLNSTIGGNNTSADVSTGKVYLGELGKGKIKWPSGATQKYDMPFSTIDAATTEYLNNPSLQSKWSQILKKYGYDTDPLRAKAMWDIAVAGASDWYQQSNGQQKVTPDQYLAWYAKGKKKSGGPSVTRQVYNYTPEEVQELIGKSAESVLGRTISQEDMQEDWYRSLNDAVNKMIAKGTVTKVEKKGGEKVVTQTPGFSQEKATKLIEKRLEKASPEDVARKERTDFASFLFGQIGNR